MSRLEKGRGVERETQLELTDTDKEPDKRVDTPSGRCTTNQALGGWGSDKSVHSSEVTQVEEGEEGANIGGDHSFIKRGVKVAGEVSTVSKTTYKESRIIVEEEIEHEMRVVKKEGRLKRKREKQIEWWTNHEKKNREKLDKQIIEEVIDKLISTTVDMSEKEEVQKVENVPPSTGLGEPLQNP